MEKENKPELLIIADDDLAYGINHGYYPEMEEQIHHGNLEVSSINSDHRPFNLTKRPLGNGKDIYVRNPYADSYVSLWDSGILNDFINTKSLAIKEVLVRMGAKHICLKEETKDIDSSKTTINAKASLKLATINGGGSYKRCSSANVKSQIESHDPSRQTKSVDKVEEFMKIHGLIGDSTLKMLLDRLKEDGSLHGIEKYSVTYCSEIENALNIAANINFKLFSSELDLSHEHNHVHTMCKEIEIIFD